MENKELTGRIIGAAITVHKTLGPGFPEEIYEAALAISRSYLKAAKFPDGLLINFATMPLTVKRVGREDPARKNQPLILRS